MRLASRLNTTLERHWVTDNAWFELDPRFLTLDRADVEHRKDLCDGDKQRIVSNILARTLAPPISKRIYPWIRLRVRS
jgi:hypothetical protein